MKNKFKLIVMLLGFAGVTGIFVFQQSKKAAEEYFVVGMSGGYAPWVSMNAQGMYEGFDIDVANQLAKKLNKKLLLQDCGSMSSLLLALQQKKIDAIIWGMCMTQDRLSKMLMVRYQGSKVTSFPLLFWDKIPRGVKSIQDMRGMTVCVEPSSTQQRALDPYGAVIQKPVQKIDDALLAIQYGKADAAITEPAIARKFIKKYPNIKVIDLPLDEASQELGVGICLNKESVTLAKQLEVAVKELEVEGVIAALEQRWDI